MKETYKNTRMDALINEIKLLREQNKELSFRNNLVKSQLEDANTEIRDFNRKLQTLNKNIEILEGEVKLSEKKHKNKTKTLENEIRRLEIENSRSYKKSKKSDAMIEEMDKLRKVNKTLICFIDKLCDKIGVDVDIFKNLLEIADGVDDIIIHLFLGDLSKKFNITTELVEKQ